MAGPPVDGGRLEDLLALVLVTSPVRSNPSTEMLEGTLRSYVVGADLAPCLKVVVSDGCTATAPGQREKPKHGRVPAEWIKPYEEFRDKLDQLVEAAAVPATARGDPAGTFARCLHLRMGRHVGFGGCTRAALERVASPYVMVIQHDRPCVRRFQALATVLAMQASGGAVKYVGLPTKASLARCAPEHARMRCGVRLSDEDIDPGVSAAGASAGVRLWPMLFWYDSTHICLVAHYRSFVFAPGRVPGGGFPEDSLGQDMHAEICAAAKSGEGWRAAHARYGTWLLVDGGGPLVGHLRGRRYVEEAEQLRQGWRAAIRRPCCGGPFGGAGAEASQEDATCEQEDLLWNAADGSC